MSNQTQTDAEKADVLRRLVAMIFCRRKGAWWADMYRYAGELLDEIDRLDPMTAPIDVAGQVAACRRDLAGVDKEKTMQEAEAVRAHRIAEMKAAVKAGGQNG